jgi:riboflavin synthase
MFTGIVTDVGRVREVAPGDGGTRFVIETRYDTAAIPLGASIACSGACLTVIDRAPGRFAAEASHETLSRTTLGDWREGTRVNLERPLAVGDELGGHIVQGHVDAVARIVGVRPDGDSMRLVVEVPAAYASAVAPKGSVTLDGVSLTVNEVEGNRFGVNLIPHTRAVTTFDAAAEGTRVNFEMDVLARYVARLLGKDLP